MNITDCGKCSFIEEVPEGCCRRQEELCPDGSIWEPNPEGIQPGQGAPPRMDPRTGLWDEVELTEADIRRIVREELDATTKSHDPRFGKGPTA